VNLIYDLDNTDKIDIILDRIGDANCVLLGEASHGTSEFYLWRAEISKRLISEKGFSFVAVEGDWPDCYKVNQYIKDNPESYSTASQVLFSFNRWPTWMWANKEMIELVEWLKDYNKSLSDGTKVGFYGLDLYSLWESMEEIIRYVKKVDPTLLRNAIRAYNCFEPYNKEVEAYARATAFVPKNCEQEVIELLVALRNKYSVASNEKSGNAEDYFNAEQNAITVVDAENYYRTMIKGDVNSWNLRDTHMTNTLQRLLNYYGNQSQVQNPKAIVWAHNTNI
jgi:erythromycin esterase-like protein